MTQIVRRFKRRGRVCDAAAVDVIGNDESREKTVPQGTRSMQEFRNAPSQNKPSSSPSHMRWGPAARKPAIPVDAACAPPWDLMFRP